MYTNKNRLLYIDNLRLAMILLVVMVHLAVTYGAAGNWYYVEPKEIGLAEMAPLSYFVSFVQAYSMGMLFLIAGYFTPNSYDKKGFYKFIIDKLIRLGIPTLLHMLIFHPFIKIVLMNEVVFDNFFFYYIKYIFSFEFIRYSGPLWFAYTLLIFSVIYALIRKIFKPEPKKEDKDFPNTFKIIVLILIISICAFLIRIVRPIGTSMFNLQVSFFSQYIILFIVGIKCKRNEWFEKIQYFKGNIWLCLGLFVGCALWSILMIFGGALDGNAEAFQGGFTWQSAAYATWESFAAVSMSIGLISFFRTNFNRQNKVISKMSSNAFAVYVFHSPIIVAVTLLLAPLNMNLLLKFFMLVPIGIAICFYFMDYIIMRIPFFKKIL